MGYHLVTIDSDAENTWLADTVRAYNIVPVWMGFNDLDTEAVWVWEDGSPVVYTNWFPPYEPNNQNNEDCARFPEHTPYTWNDFECTSSLRYICELE